MQRATCAAGGVEGTLVVGFDSLASGRFIVAAAELFQAEHPNADVQIRGLHMSEGSAGWRSGNYDMVLIGRPIDDRIWSSARFFDARTTHARGGRAPSAGVAHLHRAGGSCPHHPVGHAGFPTAVHDPGPRTATHSQRSHLPAGTGGPQLSRTPGPRGRRQRRRRRRPRRVGQLSGAQ
ncbi:LysR substrate-binding domain-containing protein [Nocardia amamiensis]|uniref:LysR substrate-binding domain-containing protein n=1 Tax=Nocardia amamiensis TaxID=404578 RepID=UPI003F800052